MLRGREGEGGRDRVPPQDSGRRADRQMGEEAYGSQEDVQRRVLDKLKGLPLLGMRGTGKLS